MQFSLTENHLRPAWWGFFVSAGLVVLLLTGQSIWHTHVESNWSKLKDSRRQDLADFLQARFNDRIESQREAAQSVLHDDQIVQAFGHRTPESLEAAFQRLERQSDEDDLSIDIVDSVGNIVLWSGRSVLKEYGQRIAAGNSDLSVFVSQASLHRYLSVGIASSDKRFYVFVSRPLETNYPVSNRFVSQRSFADDVSQELGLPVKLTFEIAPHDTAGEMSFAVPLKERQVLIYALVPVPSVTGEWQKADRLFDAAKSVLAAGAFCLLGLLIVTSFRLSDKKAAGVILWIIIIWSIRLGWKYVGFPSQLFGGFLFDPAVHSSPFPLGLASSLGELILSTAALLLTLYLILRRVLEWSDAGRQNSVEESRTKKYLGYALALVLSFVIQWLVRGYGAAMRSFVFDSTIRYQDPMSLLPNVPMVVMHFNIVMLTVALLLACFSVFIAVGRSLGGVVQAGRVSVRVTVMLCALLLAGYGLYLLLDQPLQSPIYLPLILYAFGVVWLIAWEVRGLKIPIWKGRPVLSATLLVGAAFIIAVLALDAKSHEKERGRAQLFAEELLRPVDNWLSLVVSESLRGAATRAVDQLTEEPFDSAGTVDLAFNLWAQTLMSKEGYNSALVVYDPFGKELSRFSVGLTSYEQMELLTQLFHKEEEALLLVDRKVSDGTVKYYGEWGYVLGPNVQPVGSIAILMSASQRTLFRGEAPEQLRSASQQQFEDVFRKIFISEYRGGILLSTNDPVLFKGMRIPASVEESLNSPNARFVWSEEQLGGSSHDVLYAKDDANRSRVLSLSLGSLDVRWHLFNLLKTLLVYLLFLAIFAGLAALRSILLGRPPRFGFREKLITSFAILSVLPLLLMAYYNRELAMERLDDRITRDLSEDLNVTQQRISTAVEDEQDFTQGVNNDFCESVASDLGIDFTVYKGAELKASSRPELYRSSILDSRLTGSAYVNAVTLGRSFYETQERVGEVNYIVGYHPIVVGDTIRGVLAVPALYRQQEIDEDLAQRNAFLLGAYALIVSLVVGLAIVLANTLSRPLRDLSKAARSVGKGDLDIVLRARSGDEVGDLIRSFNDMTAELKASRVHLARAERELAWKEMAKQVAHEIKNPLTPIKLSIQHLVQAYRQGSKDFGEILQRVSQTVVEQIEVLSRIASEFSNFARMPERRFERVDLSQLLGETINLFKEVDGIELEANLSATPAVVIADRDELRRVFINIVRNSVQAMERGGVITIDLRTENQICTIRMSDTGSGIPDHIQSKVFQPNFSTKTDGMGLGLAIAQKVIEDLNGSINLQSKVGKGTTIEMKIPLRYA